jgi:hypothetical protein
MVRQTTSIANGVFHNGACSQNKPFGFKELVSSFRSILHSKGKGGPDLSAQAPGQKGGEIAPELSGRPADRSQELVPDAEGRKLEPLEIILAQPLGSHRPAIPDGVGETTGRVTERGFSVEAALVEAVVRRISWGGDRRRGVARIELAGALSGTTIWVRGDGANLELEICLGPGLEASELSERLLGRLRARGLEVTGLEVR